MSPRFGNNQNSICCAIEIKYEKEQSGIPIPYQLLVGFRRIPELVQLGQVWDAMPLFPRVFSKCVRTKLLLLLYFCSTDKRHPRSGSNSGSGPLLLLPFHGHSRLVRLAQPPGPEKVPQPARSQQPVVGARCAHPTTRGFNVSQITRSVPMLWNLGKPSKIRPTVSPRQNIPAV